MENKLVKNFILESRKRGFSDSQIRKSLENKNYPAQIISDSFDLINPKFKIKNQICLFLSNEVLQSLNKRAKRNMLTVSEQIEDILRRSCTKKKSSLVQEKLDDNLLACFSRSQRGRK